MSPPITRSRPPLRQDTAFTITASARPAARSLRQDNRPASGAIQDLYDHRRMRATMWSSSSLTEHRLELLPPIPLANVTANHTISATFTQYQHQYLHHYRIRQTGGTISPSGTVSVRSGTSRTFAITPNAGHKVATVLVDGASVGAVTTYTFTNVTANHTIAVTFTRSTSTGTYTITASANTGGTISPSGTVSVSSGTSRTFRITPNSGYKVLWVLIDGSFVRAVTSYTFSDVKANHTIKVLFRRQVRF